VEKALGSEQLVVVLDPLLFLTDVFGLSINVGPFSSNVVVAGRLFSINLVPEQRMFWARRFMFSVRYT
jgi:hypothetical protein